MVCDVRFEPDSYYDQAAICRLLRLSPRALNQACRTGELRYVDRAGSRFFLGEWVNTWLAPRSDAPEAAR